MKRRFMSGNNYPDTNTLVLLHGEELKDSSRYKNTITNRGVSVVGPGKIDKCMSFSGSGFLSLPNNNYTELGVKSEFTVDFFMKITKWQTDTVQNRSAILAKGGGASAYPGYTIHISPTGDIVFTNNNYQTITASNRISLNTWYHLAFIGKGGIISLYLDGTKIIEGGIYLGGGGPLLIGAIQGGSVHSYFTGFLDELRISDVARWTSNFTPTTKPY